MWAVLLVACLAAVGCKLPQASSTSPTPPPAAASTAPAPGAPGGPVAVPTVAVGPDGAPPDPATLQVPPAGSCHGVNGLPDHTCTPGLLNPRLTPAQLCARGFSTTSIRPPARYTDALKARLMVAYGQVGTNPLTGKPWSAADVELDHLVSLEDLGHPWSPLNLWPQPRRATGAEPNADEKDQVETTVHRLICADQAHAADYAARLAADWTQFRTTRTPSPEPGSEPTKEAEP